MRVNPFKKPGKLEARSTSTLILKEAMEFYPNKACSATYSEEELKVMMQRYMRFDYQQKA